MAKAPDPVLRIRGLRRSAGLPPAMVQLLLPGLGMGDNKCIIARGRGECTPSVDVNGE